MKSLFSEMLEDVMEVVEVSTPESISGLIDEWILEARMIEQNRKLTKAVDKLMETDNTEDLSDVIDSYILSLR